MNASEEITRLRYLAAMGVPAYVTRRALPGAAPTAKFAVRDSLKAADADSGGTVAHTATDTVGAPQSRPSSGNSSSSAAAQALRESIGQKPKQQVSEAQAQPRMASAATDSMPVTRFRLAAVVSGGRLWLEELGDEALAQEQLQLISAMGRALTHASGADDDATVTEFRWPLHDNAQLGLGADEAAATLQGFLSRQLEENACVELICLGDASKALLADLSLPCARRFVYSTREVLKTPSLKRETWTALQA
ncbi:hypothetical protein [Congregibacter sp.]|uniref:hypothetical protein n=1 Tax=Congregibacter sp. TaxID=2744308 RepID=UPI003F6B8082